MRRERAGPEFRTGPQLRDDLPITVVLRGTTPSRNCLCTFARRVDAPTATSTASRRRGRMKTPSPRRRHVQGHSRHRVADVRVVPVQHDVRLHTITEHHINFELGRGPGLEGVLRPPPEVMSGNIFCS